MKYRNVRKGRGGSIEWKTIVSYDKEARMGYVTLQRAVFPNIMVTDDLHDEASIMVDVDDRETIYGFELEGEEAKKLEPFLHHKRVLVKEHEVYSLRLVENKEVQRKASMLGVEFLFAGKNYTDLIGISIIDGSKYDSKFLDAFTINAE
ncbi:hypothetical protein [Marinococcus sp. PL1-022]|uniref:hypothetical protein n=1 Tax=Marinococcus sp. PL1-022 TaxID=3095363 RepID=UPI0029C35BE1|nr:hypothetical protein [Marinococcus sp. PL1-022]MDX6153101.1 hypothetical protein [Marinococcus sp. PL1-022]